MECLFSPAWLHLFVLLGLFGLSAGVLLGQGARDHRDRLNRKDRDL